MISNYIKIAFRNLKKNRLYTFLNIIGLFAGISFFLLIGAFIWQELQVNKSLKNSESQYIITSQWKDARMGVDFTSIAPLAEELREQYPHLVANYYRWDGITSTISRDDLSFRENIQIGDESLLEMYGFKLKHGNVKTVFSNPFSVVITSERAIKYFGKTDVVGETIAIQNFSGGSDVFNITGVLNEINENTVTQLTAEADNGFFIASNSASYFNRANFESWEIPIYVSFVELQPNISAQQLNEPINNILQQNAPEDIINNLTVKPIKLTDYHLNKNNESIKSMLFTLGLVGVFIILMAIINFINISISQSGSRQREIGVRKVLGGNRQQLVFQYLIESFVLVFVSTFLACLSYPLLRGWFSDLVGKELIQLSQFPIYFFLIPILLIIIISLLVGFYPAFVMSGFKSIEAIKGKFVYP